VQNDPANWESEMKNWSRLVVGAARSMLVALAVVACCHGAPPCAAQETGDAVTLLLEYRGDRGTFQRFDSVFQTGRRHEGGGSTIEFSFERKAKTNVYVFDVGEDGAFSVCGEVAHDAAVLKSIEKNGRKPDLADIQLVEQQLPKPSIELVCYRMTKWGMPADKTPPSDLPSAVIRALSAIEQLPARPVKVGETWVREEDMDLVKSRCEFVFKGIEQKNGLECALIEGKTTIECKFVRPGATASFENGDSRMWFAVKEGHPVLVEGKITFRTDAGGRKEDLTLSSRVEFIETQKVGADKHAKLAKEAALLSAADELLREGTLDIAYTSLAGFQQEHKDSPWIGCVSSMVRNIETELPLLLKEAPELEIGEWLVPLPAKGSGTVVPKNPVPPLQSLRGKVVLIDFWATWCPPCKETIPALGALHETYSAKDLVIIGVTAVDQKQTLEDMKKYVGDNKIKYSIGVDSPARGTALAFGVRGIPTAFLLDRNGRVRWQGSPGRGTRLEAAIQRLLQENR
ncbi:MAG: TlpA disulfide reductase family protein, partial [Planctomycetota bacterium]|nr:TlpA disulfide reductase family protein [Planctomycetota bacterium]